MHFDRKSLKTTCFQCILIANHKKTCFYCFSYSVLGVWALLGSLGWFSARCWTEWPHGERNAKYGQHASGEVTRCTSEVQRCTSQALSPRDLLGETE